MLRKPVVRGRTPLFRAVSRALARARVLHRLPRGSSLRNELPLVGAAARGGDPLARRELLKHAARLGVALPAAGLLARSGFARRDDAARSAEPIAILGAGAAGLTAAYRLMQAGQPCRVFEASARIGGRIFTLDAFNKEGQFCELGAELVDTNHVEMIELAKELGVGVQELKEGDAGVELYHMGGRIYTEHDLLPEFEKLAPAIAAAQETLYVGEDEDWSDAARALDQISIREWLQQNAGECAKWVIDLIDLAYTGEYGLDAGEQSALNLLTYIDSDTSEGFKIFGESDESKRIEGGNSRLMEALARALEGKVEIEMGHELVKIGDDGASLELTFKSGGATTSAKYSRVICTLPFTVLRGVEGLDRLALAPEKLASIQTLGYGTNVKLMFGFTERAWRKAESGRPECNGSMYTTQSSQCFWETSRKQKGQSGILTNFRGGKAGTYDFTDEAVGKNVLGELDAIIPGLAAKFDGNKRSWIWPTYRFSKGAYSCPKIGQMTTVWDATAGAELDGRLMFAGEHTSVDFGGFMMGAIESGSRAAREALTPAEK
jgi:monoamine oxidase